MTRLRSLVRIQQGSLTHSAEKRRSSHDVSITTEKGVGSTIHRVVTRHVALGL